MTILMIYRLLVFTFRYLYHKLDIVLICSNKSYVKWKFYSSLVLSCMKKYFETIGIQFSYN